jgi:hypothetical protein
MVNDSFPYQKPERRGGESGDWGPGSTLSHYDGRVRWVLMAGRGEGLRGFLPVPYRNIPGFLAPIQEIFPWEFPSLSLSQTGKDFRPRLMKKYHMEFGKKLRSEEGVDPGGTELQNYDDP